MELNCKRSVAVELSKEHEGGVIGVVPPGFETKMKQLLSQPAAHRHPSNATSAPRPSTLLSPFQASLRHMRRPVTYADRDLAIYFLLRSTPISTPAPKATAKVATAALSGCR